MRALAPLPEEPSRLPGRNLDILRAVAVLTVATVHAMGIWYTAIGPVKLWELGQFGVRLFFVHTALVLMASLERLAQERSPIGTWISQFYIRRAFRIYPLAIVGMILVILFAIVMSIWWPPPTQPSTWLIIKTILANFTLTQNMVGVEYILGVMWSLSIEVQMYLLLPALYLIALKSRRWMAATFSVGVALGFAASLPIPGIWRVAGLMTFGPCFLGGVLAYYLLLRTKPRLSGLWWPAALLLTAAVFVAMRADSEHQWKTWVPCITLGLSIPFISDMAISWRTRLAAVIAKYSYGIYLTHGSTLTLAFFYLETLPRYVQWPLWLITTTVLSVAGYHLIEAPLVRIGARVASRRKRAAQPLGEVLGSG